MKASRGLHLAGIWAISVWPALNFLGSNWDKIERRGPRGLVGVIVITLVLGLVGHLLERAAEKRGHYGAMCLPWLAVICLMFSYTPVTAEAATIFEDQHISFSPTLLWWALVVAATVIVYLLRRARKVTMMATAFGIAVCAMALVRLLLVAVGAHQADPAQALSLAPVANKQPRLAGLNVYYILLDAYAGRAGFKQATGFDNTPFYDELAQRGFRDMSSEKSNYLRTRFSLGGIFSLDYPKTEDAKSLKDESMTYPALFDAAHAPPLVARLNAAGYTTFHSATTWGGCAHRYLVCLGQPFILDTNYLIKSFLEPTPFNQPIDMLAEEQDDSIRSIQSRLPLLLQKSQPYFIFAHDLGTHPPFYRTADCKWSPKLGETSQSWDDNRRSAYVGAMQCLNRRVMALVDIIIKLNPNALIVLQGDHGSAFGLKWDQPMATWTLDSIRERRSFLNLVRAPADCQKWLDHPMGQINTARFVVGCVEGHAPDYLPERGYMSTYVGAEANVVRAQPDF